MDISIKGVVFDLDGTLINSRNHIMNYQKRLFAFLDKEFPEDQQEQFFTLDHQALLDHFFTEEELDGVAAFRQQYPYVDYLHEIVPMDGAAELLAETHNRQVPCGVLTNRGQSTGRLLNMLGWQDYFSPVISADIAERPKPDPWGLIEICKQWSLQTHEIVFIGDSTLDLECGHRANVYTVLLDNPEGNRNFGTLSAIHTWLTKNLK